MVMQAGDYLCCHANSVTYIFRPVIYLMIFNQYGKLIISTIYII